MTFTYDPADWYWIVAGNETRAWSSKAMAYVTEWPEDRVTQIASESELWAVLRDAGVLKTLVRKSVIWERCTDAEFDAISAAMATAPARIRAIFDSKDVLDTTLPMFALVRQIAVQAVGAERAAQLLTPTE